MFGYVRFPHTNIFTKRKSILGDILKGYTYFSLLSITATQQNFGIGLKKKKNGKGQCTKSYEIWVDIYVTVSLWFFVIFWRLHFDIFLLNHLQKHKISLITISWVFFQGWRIIKLTKTWSQYIKMWQFGGLQVA